METLIDWLNGGGYVDNRMSSAISCFSAIGYYASGKFHLNDIAYNDKPNLYMLGIGDTGKGKEEITSGVKSINEEAFQLEDLHSYMIRVIDDVASAQGIEDALYNKGEMHQDILLSLDEFGGVLPASDKDTRREQLTTFLLRAYTYSQKKTGKRAKAEDKDNKKSGMLDHSHLNVVGATTQENLLRNLTSSVSRLGLTSRMLMFSVDEYTDGSIRLVPSKDRMPSKLRDVLNKIIHSGFASEAAGEKKGNIPKSRIKHSVSVKMKKLLLQKAKKFQEDWQKKGNDTAGARHRAYMNVKKLCMIQAIMEDPDDPIVDEEMLDVAIQYVGNSIKYQEVLFSNAVAESPSHAAELACVSVIKNNESKGLSTTNSILRRIPEMNRLNPRDKNEVIKELLETRKIFEYKVKKEGDGRGRPTLMYFSKPR